MIKLIGAVLIIVATSWAGFEAARHLTERPRQLRQLKVALQSLEAEGVLDMTPYLDFGVFKKLKDFEQFKRVRISFDTIEWACGADLDPEFVRAKCSLTQKA